MKKAAAKLIGEDRLLNWDISSPGDIAVFCGAGISKNSGLPLANELELHILSQLPIDLEDINEIINSNLPFEGFMQVLMRNSDVSAILNVFKVEIPNTNHILLARLAKKGYLRTICTTNFDMLIEKALRQEGLRQDVDYRVFSAEEQFSDVDFGNLAKLNLFKIHGSVGELDTVRTTLDAIASRASFDKAMSIIRYMFSTGTHRKILILGYSCSDVFDIVPAIESLDGSLKEIIAIDHSEHPEKREDISVKTDRNPFKKFQGIRIRTNTDRFVRNLWTLHETILGEYELAKSEMDWKKYVEDWIEQIEEQGRFRKYHIAGTLFHEISNLRRAIEVCDVSLTIAKACGDWYGQSACYNLLGGIYHDLGDFGRAIDYHRKALKIDKDNADRESVCRQYGNLGLAYTDSGDFEKAVQLYEKALRIALSIDNREAESKTYMNLGIIYRIMGEHGRAIEHHEKALEIFREIGAKADESRCYANLASVYYELEDLNKAIGLYERAVQISRDIGDRSEESKTYVNLGSVYNSLGDRDKAIELYETALRINEAVDDKQLECRCRANLASVYYELEDWAKASELFEKAAGIAKDIGDKMAEATCYMNLGTLYDKLKNYVKAIKYNLRAETILTEMGVIRDLESLYETLSSVYEKSGDLVRAEKYKRKSVEIQTKGPNGNS